jgi:glucosamine-6-phosphate deaminase
MRVILLRDREAMGHWVARHAAADLGNAIQRYGTANLVVATGSSQFEVLRELVRQPDVDWSRVQGFHLDEYVGLSVTHGASFCRYLKERFVDLVPLADFHYLHGDMNPAETIARVGDLVRQSRIDLALVGIGENGHLAFNDPPADFETEQPYLLVKLDEPCRQQQVGEGWFASLDQVPTHAISMSVRQILKAAKIYCSVPDQRKAEAVKNTLEGPITPVVPASILRTHPATTLVIDQEAASELSSDVRESLEHA